MSRGSPCSFPTPVPLSGSFLPCGGPSERDQPGQPTPLLWYTEAPRRGGAGCKWAETRPDSSCSLVLTGPASDIITPHNSIVTPAPQGGVLRAPSPQRGPLRHRAPEQEQQEQAHVRLESQPRSTAPSRRPVGLWGGTVEHWGMAGTDLSPQAAARGSPVPQHPFPEALEEGTGSLTY